MAQISESGGGGKRSLNPDINLVPFIDLLSVCICFLLMAAVWLQVGSVQVKQTYGTEADDLPKESYEIAVNMIDASTVHYELKKGAKVVQATDVKGADKAEMMVKLTEQVQASIATATSAELITSATINPAKAAPYGSLIAVMDVLRKQAIVNLAVTPKAG